MTVNSAHGEGFEWQSTEKKNRQDNFTSVLLSVVHLKYRPVGFSEVVCGSSV